MDIFSESTATKRISFEWIDSASIGDVRVFTTLLDPDLYEDGRVIGGRGLCMDANGHTGLYWSTQICRQPQRTDDDKGFTDLDNWVDLLAPTAWPIEM